MNSKVDIGEKEKNSAKDWFEELRNHICDAFEKIEISQESGPFSHLKPGKFERKTKFVEWKMLDVVFFG